MKCILNEIQTGKFAKEFIEENQTGAKKMQELRKRGKEHQIEEVGAKLREMMPWIKSNKLVDQTKN